MKLVILVILSVFQLAEKQCPSVPTGMLEAISFTNTQCHHLTDADYTVPADDPTAMPRAYGMMGLVRDGKGCFRENLKTVAALSGFTEEAILEDPETNVLAYAKAFEKVAAQMGIHSRRAEDYLPVVEALSELPLAEQKDELPMKMMLYSVYHRLGVDLKALFGEDYALLSGSGVRASKETDYPNAIWIPAPECNWEARTKEVSAVVIHITEGSYAGCISWFQNCDAQVSAHYVVRSFDGQVTQMVREQDKAWHARTANGYTIGVEHEGYVTDISYYTEAIYNSSADLMRSICSRYDVIDGHRTFCTDTLDDGTALDSGLHNLGSETACIKIRGHQHYPDQSHTDPGPLWSWNYYYRLINEGDPVVHLGDTGVAEGDFNHENYGDDERLTWVIHSDPGTRIKLDFSSFDLETDYDFLWIYDGGNVFAPQIGRWNTMSPGTVISSGNVLCVEFRSDCATTADGWRAHWTLKGANEVDEDFDLGTEPYRMTVYDVTGRIVPENQLRSGVYIVRYTRESDGKTVVKRIIR